MYQPISFRTPVARAVGLVALVGAAASLAVLPTASAQESSSDLPPAHEASSSAQALELSLFGQDIIVGSSSSRVGSGESGADGLAFASPVFDGGASSASVQGAGVDGSAEPECIQGIDQIPGVSIGLACSTTQVAVDAIGASAASISTAGEIVLNPVGPLLDTPLSALLDPVQGGLQTLIGALEPVLGPVGEGSGLDLQSTVSDLLDALLDGGDLASIVLGDSSTATSLDDGLLSTSCVAEGTRIDVLDLPAVGEEDPPPVISVILGQVSTRVDVDLATSAGSAVANPAGVTVVVPSLGLDLALALGQTLEIPLPEPLGLSTIAVTDGTRGEDEQGRSFAVADAVSLDLLNGEALMGGIELDIARCASTASAVASPVQEPAAPEEAAPPADPSPPTLPRTGPEDARPLALATTLALAGTVFAVVRRRMG